MVKSRVHKLSGHKASKSVRKAQKMLRGAGVQTLIFMTDSQRAPDPEAICARLPDHSIIIVRDYNHPDRMKLAKALRSITLAHNQTLMVAGDATLAHRVGADGLHLPEYQLCKPPSLEGFSLVSAACHSRKALLKAEALGVDFALVSPVFATKSHPDAAPLGIHRLARLATVSRVPLVALGGISAQNVAKLKLVSLMGFAAIGAFADL